MHKMYIILQKNLHHPQEDNIDILLLRRYSRKPSGEGIIKAILEAVCV